MVIAQQPFCWKWISVTKVSIYGKSEYSWALNTSYTFQPLMSFWFHTVSFLCWKYEVQKMFCSLPCSLCSRVNRGRGLGEKGGRLGIPFHTFHHLSFPPFFGLPYRLLPWNSLQVIFIFQSVLASWWWHKMTSLIHLWSTTFCVTSLKLWCQIEAFVWGWPSNRVNIKLWKERYLLHFPCTVKWQGPNFDLHLFQKMWDNKM